MKTLTLGEICVHAPTGQVGTILKTFNDGAFGLFNSLTGACFTVQSEECEPRDWQPGELEALLLEFKPMMYSLRPTGGVKL